MFLKSDNEVKQAVLEDLGLVRIQTQDIVEAIRILTKENEKTNIILQKIYDELKSIGTNSERNLNSVEKIKDRISG